MPPPVLIAPFGHLALHVSRTLLVGVSDAALAFILGRMAWRQLPLWIRQDVSLQSFTTHNSTQNDTELLGTLASVMDKLQSVVALASQRGGTIPYLHASVLAYVQLRLQYQTLYPEGTTAAECVSDVSSSHAEQRKDLNEAASTTSHTLHRLAAPFDDTTLTDCLDYSVAAYETDTDHLQHVLQSGSSSSDSSTPQATPDDDDDDWELLDHNSMCGAARPGHSIGHYVAVHDGRKRLLVAVRGTASVEEIVTDCCGGATALQSYLRQPQDASTGEWLEVVAEQPPTVSVREDGGVELESGLERIVTSSACSCATDPHHDQHHHRAEDNEYAVRCHEGILACAKRLADRMRSTVDTYVVQRGYTVLLCGHSLGAGVATLTALVLRSMLPDIERRMQVVAFAPPPVLDHDSAVAASSFTVSIVNQCDLIPRLSLVNMTVLLEFLRAVSERLQEQKLAPSCTTSTMAFMRKLMQPLHAVEEKDLLLSMEEFNAAFDQAEQRVHLRDPDHLFVAGRVLLLMEEDGGKKQTTCSTADSRDDDLSSPKLRVLDTDGSTGMLRRLEVDLFRMMSDHVTTTYYENLESVLGTTRR